MDLDSGRPAPVPKPRPFPVVGAATPGPRCGHTLTAISGPEGDLSKAKLILFGTCFGARVRPAPGPPPCAPGPPPICALVFCPLAPS